LTGELVLPSALRTPHLADSTVWSKVLTRTRADLADWFNQAVQAGLIATCDAVALELLRSAQNTAAYARQLDLLGLLPWCRMGKREFARALEVQTLLAGSGTQRGVPPVDLLIAAAAESSAIPLLHYDHDYDLIANVTGQPVRWLLPPGSLP